MKPDNEVLTKSARQRRLLLQSIGGAGVLAGFAISSTARAQAAPKTQDGVIDVAVIGAGLAGLTAARNLKTAGCNSLIVLEARDRVGGRTYNHDLGNGIVSEAGGQWIGAGQTAIADLARELNVDTFPTFYKGKNVYLIGDTRVEEEVKGGAISDHTVVSKLNALAATISSKEPWTSPNAASLDQMSLGDWLAKQGLSSGDRLTFDTSVSLTFGTPPSNLAMLHYLTVVNSSLCDIEKLEGFEGGAQETRIVGGSQILSIRMAEELGEHVRLSCPVRRIVGWDSDSVEIHTDHGVTRARQVILALHPALCNQIQFDPPLPEGRAQLQRLWPSHAPMRKTVHVYSRPFWRDKGFNGQITQADGPLILAYDNSPPDGSIGVLSAFVRSSQLPAQGNEARDQLSALYARALGEEALHPTQFHDYDWGKVDPWTQSCVAPIPPGFLTRWGKYLKPAVGRLIWAGTETADLWTSSMDGAVRSGRRAALEALQGLSSQREVV